MKRVAFLSFVFLLLAVFVSGADARCGKCMGRGGDMGPGMGMGMTADHPMMGMIMGLGLDDKQQEAIKAIHFHFRKEIIRKRADLGIARIELTEILGNEPVDMAAAEAKVRQIEALKADMMITHLKAFEEIKSKLTPAQRNKLKKMMMRHMSACMMDGRCNMMPGMQGMMGMRMMGMMDDESMGPAADEGEMGPAAYEGETGPAPGESEMGPAPDEGEMGPAPAEGEMPPPPPPAPEKQQHKH